MIPPTHTLPSCSLVYHHSLHFSVSPFSCPPNPHYVAPLVQISCLTLRQTLCLPDHTFLSPILFAVHPLPGDFLSSVLSVFPVHSFPPSPFFNIPLFMCIFKYSCALVRRRYHGCDLLQYQLSGLLRRLRPRPRYTLLHRFWRALGSHTNAHAH